MYTNVLTLSQQIFAFGPSNQLASLHTLDRHSKCIWISQAHIFRGSHHKSSRNEKWVFTYVEMENVQFIKEFEH